MLSALRNNGTRNQRMNSNNGWTALANISAALSSDIRPQGPCVANEDQCNFPPLPAVAKGSSDSGEHFGIDLAFDE